MEAIKAHNQVAFLKSTKITHFDYFIKNFIWKFKSNSCYLLNYLNIFELLSSSDEEFGVQNNLGFKEFRKINRYGWFPKLSS